MAQSEHSYISLQHFSIDQTGGSLESETDNDDAKKFEGYLKRQLFAKIFEEVWVESIDGKLHCYKFRYDLHAIETIDLRLFDHGEIIKGEEFVIISKDNKFKKRFKCKSKHDMNKWLDHLRQNGIKMVDAELKSHYVDKETLKGAGISLGVGAAAGGVTGVAIGAEAGAVLAVGTGAVVSAPVIIPALIGAGVIGAIGTGIALLVAKNNKKDALYRKQEEDMLTERKDQKLTLERKKQS